MRVIKLENVGKKFILTHQNDKINRSFFSSLSGQRTTTEFWALKNINLEVEKGKVVGLIGRNGAGKSTLLNIIAGISSPTIGKIEINGRVSCLLTLGAGFQNELTGRENIYLNSSILGMSRNEINKKYRSIVEFSELDGFLDSPLQTYSQGMRLRLGFSVAIHMDFDILLIDEILSVGDVWFQKKCFDKIDEFRKQGKTMVITTQALGIVERICEEVFLLENGEIAQHGYPQKVTARYLELLNEKRLPETFLLRYGKLRWWADKRFWEKKEGSREVRIVEASTYNSSGKQTNQFKPGESIIFKAYFIVDQEVIDPHFGVAIFREDGVYCYGPNTSFDGYRIERLNKGEGFFSIHYKSLILRPGKYRFSAAIWDKDEVWAYDYHVGYYKFEIIGDNKNGQLINLKYRWQPDSWWRKFTISNSENIDSLLDINLQEQDDIVHPDIEIDTVELLGSDDEPRYTFHTGEDLKIKLHLKVHGDYQELYLWLGLFRGDGIYCHGAIRRIKEDVVSLTYHSLPLLTGDYYLSAGIWKRNNRTHLLLKHKISAFKISFFGKDHGTVFLEHNWEWKLP